jgi:hypothetical protein
MIAYKSRSTGWRFLGSILDVFILYMVNETNSLNHSRWTCDTAVMNITLLTAQFRTGILISCICSILGTHYKKTASGANHISQG